MKLLLVGMFWKDETGRAKAWWSCFSLLGDFTSLKGKCDGGEHTGILSVCREIFETDLTVDMCTVIRRSRWLHKIERTGVALMEALQRIFTHRFSDVWWRPGQWVGKGAALEACTGCMGAMCIPAILARFVLTPFFCSLSLNELYMGVNLGTSHS
jgi:hypothetical protein